MILRRRGRHAMRSALALVILALTGVVGVAHAQQPLEPLPPPPPNTSPSPQTTPTPAPPPTTSDFGVPEAHPPAADRQPYVKTDEELAKEFRPSFKGSFGYQYAQTYGIPMNAGRMRLGVGGQTDTQAHYAVLAVKYGSTADGLRTWDFRVSWNGDLYRMSILRLGVDVETGYLVVRRATIDRSMWALGIGAGVHASVDLYQFGYRNDHAIFVEAKFDAHIHFGGAFVWGPSVLAGVRY